MSLGENSLVAAYQGKGQLKSRPSGTRVVTVYKCVSGFSGARKLCINTSPAQERCFQILPRLLRRQRGISIYIYLSDTSPAPDMPGKYLYKPFLPEKPEK